MQSPSIHLLLFLLCSTIPLFSKNKPKSGSTKKNVSAPVFTQQPEQKQMIKKSAVTYTFSGGRFGDDLVAYLHAKWVSYKYSIPLLYKPFPYSDHLMMHEFEQPYIISDVIHFEHQKTLEVGETLNITQNSSTLYTIPYFPECLQEHKRPDYHFPYFSVDWDDEGFISEIKKTIWPRGHIEKIKLPTDKITVAVHIRKRTKEFDGPILFEQPQQQINLEGYADRWFPFKFAPDEYYQEQIKRVSAFLGHQPLYVYLFTDALNPIELMEKYAHAIQLPNIEFDCRRTPNRHNMNVLEDFFALTQFDCLIRIESNFSLIASKLAHYRIHVTPKHYHFHTTQGYPVIDQVVFTVEKEKGEE